MDASKTSLSAGEIIHELLSGDRAVMPMVTKVYPVAEDKAQLPYVVYRRTGLEQDPTKRATGRKADVAIIEVSCYAKGYDESVTLAEAVRAALDGRQADNERGLVMRSCMLTDASEDWAGDAYEQVLVFEVRI